MSEFYTSCSRVGSFFYLRGWKDGIRMQTKVPIEPYLFVRKPKAAKDSEFKTIYGDMVERIKFSDPKEAQDFINLYKGVSGFEIHGMTQWLYPFLNDRYTGIVPYDASKIRGINFDIEVDTVNGLPNIKEANKEIVSITARKTNGDIVAWGLVDFDSSKFKEARVEYRRFQSERSLLQDFVTWWKSWDADYVTGWNIDGFDIPYLIKRLDITCGGQWVNMLSPWGKVSSREFVDKFGAQEVFEIKGIEILDYIALYKKFTYAKQESYSLDFIASEELGASKLDYKAQGYKNLGDLYTRNPQLFIEYNITDVLRVQELDAKMGLIALVFSLAYTAKVPYSDTLGTVKLWDALIHNHLMEKRQVVPLEVEGREDFVEGAFVKEPVPGLYKWVVSFDLASLYPHIIMQNNISPETFVGYTKIRPSDVIDQTDSFRNVQEYALREGLAICGNGALYRKDKVGFLPELMDKFYSARKTAKKEMLALEQQRENGQLGLNSEIARLHNYQMALKIALNSAYGSLANLHFRYYDSRAAEGITQTGFVAIQWVADALNKKLRSLTNRPEKDFIIAIDTDSVYLNLEDIVAAGYKGQNNSVNAISAWLDKVCEQKLQPLIEESYARLAEVLNSPRQMMQMKREAICDKAVWVAKKRYLLNVINSEGVQYKEPKLKVSGLESKRSSTPIIARKGLERAYKKIIEQNEGDFREEIAEFKTAFMATNLHDIASPSTANDIESFSLGDKSIPYHIKAALLYNDLITQKGLTSELPLIKNGDKIRLLCLKTPNPLKNGYIATLDEPDRRVFDTKYIDREAQYNKVFLSPIKGTIAPIGWSAVAQSTIDSFFS